MPSQAIWTPDGVVDLDGKKRERVELRAGLTEWFAQFEAVAQHFGLGLHCSRCKADVIGKNGSNDKMFSVSCECRDFVGSNRDYRPEPVQKVN